MKHGWLRLAILLIAAGLCAGMFFYTRETPPPKTETLTLWYAEGDCDSAAMESLITRCRKETGIQLQATAYADEEKLGAAFEGLTGRSLDAPDLLFCSHVHAVRFEERAGLAEIAAALPVPEMLSDTLPAAGRSFFPIGSRLPVLLVNTTLTDGSFESFEALLAAAGETPFLGCDCAASLLYTEAAAKGISLTGDAAFDMKDGQVSSMYNELALAAFRGGLVLRERAADYVCAGQLACTVTMSATLAGLAGKGLDVRLLPLPAGTDERYPVELMGFALLDGADTAVSERFFQWLWTGSGAETALAAGMVPFQQIDAGGGELAKCLNAAARNAAIYPLDPDEPWVQNRAALDKWLREALDLLA